MTSSPGSLLKEVNESYRAALKTISSSRNSLILHKEHIAMMTLEQVYPLLDFWKYEEAESAIKTAQAELGVYLNLSGKKGVKTKFQSFKVSYLTAEIIQTPDQDQVSQAQGPAPHDQSEGAGTSVKVVSLDEDVYALVKPRLDPGQDTVLEEGERLKVELSIFDRILVQGMIYYVQQTSYSRDQLKDTQVEAYLNAISTGKKPMNGRVFSKSLLIRSKNEFKNS